MPSERLRGTPNRPHKDLGAVEWLLYGAKCYVGGCQNYGPLLDPDYNTAPNI